MRKLTTLLVSFALLAITTVIIFSLLPKHTSFEKVVLSKLDVSMINEIEVTKTGETEQTVNLSETTQIQKLVDEFSKAKLKKAAEINSSTESYWITIIEKNERRFGLTLYGEKQIEIYDYQASKNKSSTYDITNDFDASTLLELFK